MTSQFKESMEQMNEEMTNSVLTAASILQGQQASRSRQGSPAKASAVSIASDAKQQSGEAEQVELTDSVLKLQSELVSSEEARNALQAEFVTIQGRSIDIESALAAKSREVEDLRVQAEANIAELIQQLSDATSQHDAAEARAKGFEEQLAAIERDLDGKLAVISILEGVQKAREEELQTLRKGAGEHCSSLQELQQQLQVRAGEVETLLREKEELQNEVTQRTQEIEESLCNDNSKYLEVAEQLAMTKRDYENAQAELETLKEALVGGSSSAEVLQQELDSVRADLHSSQELVERQIQELDQTKQQLDEFLSRASDLKGRITAIEAEKTDLAAQLAAAESASSKQLHEAEQKIADLVERISFLEASEDGASAMLEKLTSERDLFQVETQTLANRLQLITAELTGQINAERERADGEGIKAAKASEDLRQLHQSTSQSAAMIGAKCTALEDEVLQLKAECVRLDGELTNRVVDDASMRDANRNLETRANALSEELAEVQRKLKAAEDEGVRALEALRGDLEDARSRTNQAQEIVTGQKEALARLQEEAGGRAAELEALKRQLQTSEANAQGLPMLTQELSAAKAKLSKIEEKKKREFENLKRQNELIARLQRDKDVGDRAHEADVAALTERLDELKAEKDEVAGVLAERVEALHDLEDKYNMLMESESEKSHVEQTFPAPVDVDSSGPCSRCGELEAALERARVDSGLALEMLHTQLAQAEDGKKTACDAMDELASTRADWIQKLSAAEKELIKLRMCEKGLASKTEEVQFLEQEVTKVRALVKERDAVLAERETAVLALQEQVQGLRYKMQKELISSASTVRYLKIFYNIFMMSSCPFNVMFIYLLA